MIGRSRRRWAWLLLAWALPGALTAQAPRLTHATPSGSVHELVLVPEGPFMMGRPEPPGTVPHLAEHQVYLSA